MSTAGGPATSGRGRGLRIVSQTTDAEFRRFYHTEWHSVLGLAVVLCGDRNDAEDLAQEGFAAAYRDWHRIGLYDRPGAFVRRVVANKAVSRTRRILREGRALKRLAGRGREPGLPPELDESWALVRRLPARQAQVVALMYLEDRSLSEVALMLGISTETAKTHLSRARRALARHITDDLSPATSSEGEPR